LIIIENQYELEQMVYLKTDPDQLRRLVTGVMQTPDGILYQLTFVSTVSLHYEFEISDGKDTLNP
jgi:hypothetical protein